MIGGFEAQNEARAFMKLLAPLVENPRNLTERGSTTLTTIVQPGHGAAKNAKSPSQAVDFHQAQRQNRAKEIRRPRRVSSPPSPMPEIEPVGSMREQANEVTRSTRAAGREAIARSRSSYQP